MSFISFRKCSAIFTLNIASAHSLPIPSYGYMSHMFHITFDEILIHFSVLQFGNCLLTSLQFINLFFLCSVSVCVRVGVRMSVALQGTLCDLGHGDRGRGGGDVPFLCAFLFRLCDFNTHVC